jgi:hypothetical protein
MKRRRSPTILMTAALKFGCTHRRGGYFLLDRLKIPFYIIKSTDTALLKFTLKYTLALPPPLVDGVVAFPVAFAWYQPLAQINALERY